MGKYVKKNISFDSINSFELNASNFIIDLANNSIKEKGFFSIVLCGGGTPKNIYSMLKQMDTDWTKWNIFFGDERCLPINDKDRNSFMAKEAFLDHVAIPTDQIFYMDAELGNIRAAKNYNKLLLDKGDFDLVLLGFGEDGHTASLFPGHNFTNDEDTIAVSNAPKPPSERVSLTPKRLSRANVVLFLITGTNKQTALNRWRDENDLPPSLIKPKKELVIFTFGLS